MEYLLPEAILRSQSLCWGARTILWSVVGLDHEVQRLRCHRSCSVLLFTSRRELVVYDGVNGTFAHRCCPWPLFNALTILKNPQRADATKCSKGIPLWMLWLLLHTGQKRQETKIPCPTATSVPLVPFAHHVEHKSNGESACYHCSLLAASHLKQQMGSQHPTPSCRSHPVPFWLVGKWGNNKGITLLRSSSAARSLPNGCRVSWKGVRQDFVNKNSRPSSHFCFTAEGGSCGVSPACSVCCRNQRNSVKMLKEKKPTPPAKQPVGAFSAERKVGQGWKRNSHQLE